MTKKNAFTDSTAVLFLDSSFDTYITAQKELQTHIIKRHSFKKQNKQSIQDMASPAY